MKTDFISPGIGMIYADAFENRQESDYQDFIELNAADVAAHYSEMLIFITKIEEILIERI